MVGPCHIYTYIHTYIYIKDALNFILEILFNKREVKTHNRCDYVYSRYIGSILLSNISYFLPHLMTLIIIASMLICNMDNTSIALCVMCFMKSEKRASQRSARYR